MLIKWKIKIKFELIFKNRKLLSHNTVVIKIQS